MARLTEQQLVEVEAMYRSGEKPAKIAQLYGVTETAIRNRAKRLGWVQQPASAKRELVSAVLSGLTREAHEAVKERNGTVRDLIQGQAELDARVLSVGAEVFKLALERLWALSSAGNLDVRDTKSVCEAAKVAIDGYRRARGLDDGVQEDGFEAWARAHGFIE